MNKRHLLATAAMMLALAACTVGPDYKRPKSAEPTPAFKEGLNWKQAQPADATIRGKWWEMFNDPDLNKLEEQVNISNETVKASEAAFRQARALVAEARSGYFPTLSANGSVTRSGSGGGSRGATSTLATSTSSSVITTGSGSSSATTSYNAGLDVSWEPDLWGSIRRTVEANKATAQATAADLALARLSAQAELAIDYIDLRVADEQKRLLDQTIVAYTRSLQITKNLYASGVDARSDVLQAQTQLETTQAQEIDVGVQRAQYEHAIAILIGKAPANFSLAPVNSLPGLPPIPVSVPSELLERRPDIAGAERRVAAANAQIGVAEAAFFPNLTLSASGGYQSSSFSNWFSLPNRFWSIGPSLVETVFDAGLRAAQTEAAIAAYDQTVANYRQTVLGGFQEVEDNLAGLRILAQENDVQQQAVKDAQATTKIALNQYKSGIVSYINVITAQTIALNNELTLLTLEKARLTDAATLIKALGGGWDAKELNAPSVTQPKTTPFSLLPPSIPKQD